MTLLNFNRKNSEVFMANYNKLKLFASSNLDDPSAIYHCFLCQINQPISEAPRCIFLNSSLVCRCSALKSLRVSIPKCSISNFEILNCGLSHSSWWKNTKKIHPLKRAFFQFRAGWMFVVFLHCVADRLGTLWDASLSLKHPANFSVQTLDSKASLSRTPSAYR